MRTRIAVALSAALITGLAGSALADADFEQKMDRFVERSLEAFGVVPGFAICVVNGDQTVYIRGFGYRDVEKKLPVTADTGFYIASSTKSFTGMAASVLADQGELDLDAPVSRYLPELELPDPLSADEITLREMLTHRTGVNNVAVQRQLAFVNSLTKREFLELMRTQSKPMPAEFIYTNLGYNMFGYVLEEVSGEPWQQVIAETVLEPVGMASTTTSIEVASQGNFALPYTRKGDTYHLDKLKSDATMHAAGGLASTPADLARWLIVNLNQGVIDGREVLAPRAVRTAHASYATTDREFYRFRRTGYSLGWYHSDFEGELLLHHFGGFSGYHAHVSFMPEHRIGVAALINTNEYEASMLAHMVAAFAYENLLGHSNVEAEYEEELANRSARTRAKKRLDDELTDAMDMLKSGEVAGGTAVLLSALESGVEADVVSEGTINNLGYSLLKEEQTEPAIAVFQFNAETNSESPNVYDSLGEVYEKIGRLELAKENYAKAYEIGSARGDRNTNLFKENLDRVVAKLR